MLCGTKLSSNKNAKSDLTLTPDKLDYIIHTYIYIHEKVTSLTWKHNSYK